MSSAPEERSPDTSTPACQAREVRLPPFCRLDASTWFRRAEVQFRLKAITSTYSKSDYVLASLPDDVFPLISEWLASQGDAAVPYDRLKPYLLKRFVPAPEERAERLLQLSRQPLGDQRASDAFGEMRTLTRLPPAADGTPRSLDLLRILWLLRLPDAVRSSLTDVADLTEDVLLHQADAFQNAHRATQSRPAFAASSAAALVDDVDDDVPDASLAAAATQRRLPKTSRRRPSGKVNQPSKGNALRSADPPTGYCFFHRTFGQEARNCRSPCSWPKNV